MLTLSFLKINFIDKATFYFKLFCFIILTLKLIFLKILVQMVSKKLAIKLVQLFHKLALWFMNIDVEVTGVDYSHKVATLYVSNHLSYIDIPILGSLINAKFIAKAEISSWPFIGFLSRIGNTVFINRNLKFLKKNKTLIFEQMSKGENLILFPEGTTSDGIRVLNFKSSLFSSVENRNIMIQPIVIYYKSVNGIPLNRWLKPIIAWYGDMDLKPHLINIFKLISIKAKVIFLPPINGKNFNDRKDMTYILHHAIDNFYSNELNKTLLK